MTRVRANGRVIACWDYPVIRDLVKKSSVPHLTYGSAASGARFTAGRVRQEGGWTRFHVFDFGTTVDQIRLRVPGDHNVLNALAVWIECRELGLPGDTVRLAFESFRGVKRRQEERGQVGGVLVIDDFAHHPTAVRETLRALKRRY